MTPACPKRRVGVWTLLVVLALASVAWGEAAATMPLLTNVEALQERFDRDRGHHRLVLLVDPG